MSRKNGEFISTIINVRAVEDSIRATKKYTEGILTRRKQHPIQGEDFPSKMFCKYYEVYPNVDVSWDMPAGKAWAWVWGDMPHIDVVFEYDYREDKAKVRIQDGEVAIKQLANAIPGFSFALGKIAAQVTPDWFKNGEKQANEAK